MSRSSFARAINLLVAFGHSTRRGRRQQEMVSPYPCSSLLVYNAHLMMIPFLSHDGRHSSFPVLMRLVFDTAFGLKLLLISFAFNGASRTAFCVANADKETR